MVIDSKQHWQSSLPGMRGTSSLRMKGSNFYVKADLTKKKENSLTYARERIRSDPGVRKFVKYVYVDPNCNLMAAGRFTRFNSECDFD